MNKIFTHKSGSSLVELMIAIGLFAALTPALITSLITSRNGKAQQQQRNQAVMLLKDIEESIRNVKNNDWTKLTPVNTDLYVTRTSTSWNLVSGTENINGFSRKIIINDVYRDSNNNIISTGLPSQIDLSTKKITSTVSWTQPRSSSVESVIYLTRHANFSYITDNKADFDPGTTTETQVTNSGEITLANGLGAKAKWCSPEFSKDSSGNEITINLPDGPPVAVAALANHTSTSTPNDVFVAVAPTTSTSIKLAYLTVTANTDQPIPTLKGKFTLNSGQYSSGSFPSNLGGLDNNFKTNDVKSYVSPLGKTYALLATNLSDHEVIAVLVKDENGNEVFQDSVNKIYKYQTFFDTRIYGSVATGSTTPPSPTPTPTSSNTTETASSFSGNVSPGNYNWSSSNNAAVSDNSYATVNIRNSSNTSNHLLASNFGFSLPTNAIINGVEAKIERSENNSSSSFIRDNVVRLVKNGSIIGNNKAATSTNWPTTDAVVTYGNSSDLWGTTWSASDINDSDFGLALSVGRNGSSNETARVDQMTLTVYYTIPSPTSTPTTTPIPVGGNDQSPFGYGATSLAVMGNTGYVSSGGYLYTFDLSNIDSKTPTNGLNQIGCRIELDGFDCQPSSGGWFSSGSNKKYSSGQSGTSWSDSQNSVHDDCSDGGNIELYADNDIYPVQIGSNKYIFVAVGSGINPELDIINVTNPPSNTTSPTINNGSCGRISGGSNDWKRIGSLDFNSASGTEEAANSVYVNADGTRAYISSNGGIDANNDGRPDSYQLYVIDTSNKSSPHFLSGSSSASSGYYYGSGANAQLYPRRSLTVLNGQRAILVGRDAVSDGNDSQEYQVLNIENESSPAYCGGVNFNQGFNDLTSVSEADGDNFVYMVANTMEKQLKIIQGGPDNSGNFMSTGTYESPTFSLSGLPKLAFNRFSTSVNLPTGSNVKFQVSVANAVSNSCSAANFSYVGPSGTADTYFPYGGGVIPFSSSGNYLNPGQCFRYKAYLYSTPDMNQSPSIDKVIVNYSP